ncbi:hypothetical protein [Volucribacter amazonae]|nr:hypothetical protein [Volucribacter amazonae]
MLTFFVQAKKVSRPTGETVRQDGEIAVKNNPKTHRTLYQTT